MLHRNKCQDDRRTWRPDTTEARGRNNQNDFNELEYLRQ